MFFTPWLRWRQRATGSGKTARRPSFVPRLLVLEDRSLPSTLTVLNNLDSGAGSLRDLLAGAHPGDMIQFDHHLAGQTITLTSGELVIDKSLDIEGLGADQLAVSGNHASRVFAISGGVTVTIAGLTITDGRVVGDKRGGILNVGSTLTLAHDVLSDNEALGATGSDPRGGAISNLSGAHLTVTDSLFAHNQVIGGLGDGAGSDGLGVGGGVYNLGTFLVDALTLIRHNHASTSNDDRFGC